MIIHIGYHKTATSWLQDLYFPAIPELACWEAKSDLRKWIVEPHSLDFDPEAVRARFGDFLAEAAHNDRIALLSQESFCGSPHNGGAFSKEIADRLHALFPGSRILAVIRRQDSMIASAYRQYVRTGGITRFEDYIRPPVRDAKLPLFRLENYRYHQLLSYYGDLFGRENVGVLLFEDFCEAPEAFLEKLSAFIGVQAADAPPIQRRVKAAAGTDATLGCRRVLNMLRGGVTFNPVKARMPTVCDSLRHLIKKSERWIAGDVRPDNLRLIDRKALKAATGFYGESNRKLIEDFGVDLEKYGYER